MTIEITLIERGKRYGSLAGHARITQGIKREIQGFVKYEGDATRPWDKLSDDKKEALDMIAAGRNHFKMPNLEEALQFFCNKSVGENAHDALVDAEACLEVFFASRKMRAMT